MTECSGARKVRGLGRWQLGALVAALPMVVLAGGARIVRAAPGVDRHAVDSNGAPDAAGPPASDNAPAPAPPADPPPPAPDVAAPPETPPATTGEAPAAVTP